MRVRRAWGIAAEVPVSRPCYKACPMATEAPVEGTKRGVLRCRGCGALNNYAGVRAGKVPKCGACRGTLDVSGRSQGVDGESLSRTVEGAPIPVILLVWDPSDPACRSAGAALDRFATRDPGSVIALTVDVEIHPRFPNERSIETIPTLVLFRDGAEVDRNPGGLSEQELARWVAPPES